jgi:hypothetical protein
MDTDLFFRHPCASVLIRGENPALLLQIVEVIADGDKAFDAVSGVSMFGDGSALNDKIRDICAAGGRVEFAREGVVVAAAPCTAPLPPARPVFRIVRAFG